MGRAEHVEYKNMFLHSILQLRNIKNTAVSHTII